MGGSVIARDLGFTFHRSSVLEIRHTPGRPKHVVVKLCYKRISIDHPMVLHIGGVSGRDPIYPGYLDALDRAVHASFDRGGSPLLGNSEGIFLFWSRL